MVLMTCMLALMKIYFLFCMPNTAYGCPKVLLNVHIKMQQDATERTLRRRGCGTD